MRILTVVAALLFVAGCTAGKDAVSAGSDFQFVSPGGKVDLTYEGDERQQIPALRGDSLMKEGTELSLADYEGDVVVLNIWGAWCPPCRSEAAELQEVWDGNRDAGMQLLGINVKDPDRSAPQDFLRNHELTYPSIYDPAARTLLALKGYPRSAVPSTIVLDKKHRVAAIFLRDLLAEDLQPVVDRLLAEK